MPWLVPGCCLLPGTIFTMACCDNALKDNQVICMVLQDRCTIIWNMQNNDTFQYMLLILKTWFCVGLEYVLVERYGV